MTDRHCRIGRIAVPQRIEIPGYTLVDFFEQCEDYDAPPPAPPSTWFVYRHHNPEVGRYGS